MPGGGSLGRRQGNKFEVVGTPQDALVVTNVSLSATANPPIRGTDA
jgi:hypothetical protein